MDILIIYLVIINAAALLLMLADKHKAVKNTWRIPELTLMCTAALGGSFGVLLVMKLFHHKTRKPKFSIGVPLLLSLHILLFVAVYTKAA